MVGECGEVKIKLKNKSIAKTVEYNYITGQPSAVLMPLKISVAIFLIYNSEVKVGITRRDPQERFNEHLKNKDWYRMIVKYVTK